MLVDNLVVYCLLGILVIILGLWVFYLSNRVKYLETNLNFVVSTMETYNKLHSHHMRDIERLQRDAQHEKMNKVLADFGKAADQWNPSDN